MHADHRRPPSRSTLERLGKALGTQTQRVASRIEAALRREETVPAGTHAIVLGLDRTTVTMEEPRPAGAAPDDAAQGTHDAVCPHPAGASRCEVPHGLCGNGQSRRSHGRGPDRMRYATLRRVGLPCGSGATEGACKSVVTMRAKGSGQRWHDDGVTAAPTPARIYLSERLPTPWSHFATECSADVQAAA